MNIYVQPRDPLTPSQRMSSSHLSADESFIGQVMHVSRQFVSPSSHLPLNRLDLDAVFDLDNCDLKGITNMRDLNLFVLKIDTAL